MKDCTICVKIECRILYNVLTVILYKKNLETEKVRKLLQAHRNASLISICC